MLTITTNRSNYLSASNPWEQFILILTEVLRNQESPVLALRDEDKDCEILSMAP